MPALAEREDIQAATDAIHAQRAQLQAVFDEKTQALEDRIAEAESVERNHRKLMKAANLAADRVGELSTMIKAEMPAAILRIIDGADSEALNFKPLALVEPLVAERARVLLFISELEFYLQESNELRLVAQAGQLFAEADQVLALAEQREFDLHVALAPIADSEGQILFDRSKTVTGELRRKAANLQLEAHGINGRIAGQQQHGKGNY